MRVAALAVFLLTACRAGPTAPADVSAHARVTEVSAVEVRQVLIDTPRPVPPGPDPGTDSVIPEPGSQLPASRTTIGLVVRSPYRCDMRRALELREYEGSILGSHGIHVAVTYFVPILRTDGCELDRVPHEQAIAVPWERRADTEWTIVVAGYTGAVDRVPGTVLFARRLTDHEADRETAAALAAMPRAKPRAIASMSNLGEIQVVSARGDAATGDIVVSARVRYGNRCEASTPWRLEPLLWTPAGGTIAHLWITIEPPAKRATCGEIFDVSPAPVATSTLRIAAPAGATSVAVMVPNVKRGTSLPIYTATVALQ